MAKEVAGLIKLQIRGGAANPSPPVGPALGAKGVNIMEFCKQFNARTQDKPGKILPCVITVFADKSFEFVIKTPPNAETGSAARASFQQSISLLLLAIPQALLCFITMKVFSENSEIKLTAASTSSRLLYESSFPFN
mgnify:CR=1 FL=1